MRKFNVHLDKLAQEYGAANLRFFIPTQIATSLHGIGLPVGMTCSSDPFVEAEFEVCEERYKMEEGYKIGLKPVNAGNADPQYVPRESFYQSDLEGLIEKFPEEYRIYVLVDADNKYERIRFPD